jgi:ribosomal protein S3
MKRITNKKEKMKISDVEFKVGLDTNEFEKASQRATIVVKRLSIAIGKLEEPIKKLVAALGELKGIDIGINIEKKEKKEWWEYLKFWKW